MTKDVLISIRGTQRSHGEEPQTIELTTDGQLRREGDALLLSYVETEVTGLEGVVTTFRVEGDGTVQLLREGATNATMTFVEGEKTESLYDVGFGAMLLGVSARKVVSRLHEGGGTLFVDYAVELEHVPVGSNTYEIAVRESPELS